MRAGWRGGRGLAGGSRPRSPAGHGTAVRQVTAASTRHWVRTSPSLLASVHHYSHQHVTTSLLTSACVTDGGQRVGLNHNTADAHRQHGTKAKVAVNASEMLRVLRWPLALSVVQLCPMWCHVTTVMMLPLPSCCACHVSWCRYCNLCHSPAPASCTITAPLRYRSVRPSHIPSQLRTRLSPCPCSGALACNVSL